MNTQHPPVVRPTLAAGSDQTWSHDPDNYVSHTAGHWPVLAPDCEVCDGIYARRQANVFAAARVLRDSNTLQAMPVSDGGYTDRAELALRYVENVHSMYGSGDDFDNRYIGTWFSFREYADQTADELIDDSGDAGLMTRYFDYDMFARDLQFDYDVVELAHGVAIFSQ